MKLLCVDSEEIYREIISLCAKKHGFQVQTVDSFHKAITAFENWQPDIVTMDVFVNGGCGLTLLKKLKALANSDFVPVIFLSSHGSDVIMEKCFRAGADDFLPKPFHEALFRARIETHKHQIQLLKEMSKKNRELTYYQTMIEREHKMAHQVLDHILVRNENGDQSVAITKLAAASFNGDLALVSTRSDGARLIFVGDFTGHGLSASIGALPVAQAFFDAVDYQFDIAEFASRINRMLLAILPDYMFCAAYIILINPDGHLYYWGGGMPNAYVKRDNGKLQVLRSMHMPLGILGASEFESSLGHIIVDEHDTLVVVTDGVLELKNENGCMLGAKALEEMITGCYGHVDLQYAQTEMQKALLMFQGNSEQNDDITFAAIRKQH